MRQVIPLLDDVPIWMLDNGLFEAGSQAATAPVDLWSEDSKTRSMIFSSADPVEPPVSSTRRASVLVVDDEPALLRGLKRALSEHDVITASNVDQGMALYCSHNFDIVFCDVMMPESTGVEFYTRLSALGPEHAKRLVLMTGGVFSDRLGCSLSQVPSPCILKPFRSGELELLIDQALARAG